MAQQYIATFRQIIPHDEPTQPYDDERNRWLGQKNLVEIVRQDSVIFPEYIVRVWEAWFVPIERPSNPVPKQPRNGKNGFFSRERA